MLEKRDNASEEKKVKRKRPAAAVRGLGAARKKLSLIDPRVQNGEKTNKKNSDVQNGEKANTENIDNKENIDPQVVTEPRVLVLERRYCVDHLTWISIGIDPLNNFNCVVRLTRNFNRLLQFKSADFEKFLSCRKMIDNYFNCTSDIGCMHPFGEYKLYFYENSGTKIISIKDTEDCKEMHFNWFTYNQLFYLSDIIRHYIRILEKLNINKVIEKLIIMVNKSSWDLYKVADSITELDNSLCFFALKETLCFYSDVMRVMQLETTLSSELNPNSCELKDLPAFIGLDISS